MNNKKKRRNFKPRGPNRCKKLANLKNGEKLELTYFHNGPVGENHNLITRHMGMLVKDCTVCPVCVHSWNDIDESAKEHIWAAVKVIAYGHEPMPLFMSFFGFNVWYCLHHMNHNLFIR